MIVKNAAERINSKTNSMKIIINEISTESISIGKDLVFKCTLEFSENYQIPLGISGFLISSDNKIVSNINEYTNNTLSNPLALMPTNQAEQIRKKTQNFRTVIPVELVSSLNKGAINHLEQLRLENNQRDVELRLKLKLKFLGTSFDTNSFSQTITQLINYNESILHTEITIPQSEWLRKFSSYLEIGSFFIVEINKSKMIKLFESFKELGDRDLGTFIASIEKAIDKVETIESHIKKGEWEISMRYAREFFELLRFKKTDDLYERLKNKFVDRNGTDVGFQDLYEATQGLFEYSSKFIHEKDKKGNIHVKPTAKMEDAYFIFSLCVNTLYLIISKI